MICFISDRKLERYFAQIMFHIDENLSEESYYLIRKDIEDIDGPNVTNYWLNARQKNFVYLKHCEELQVNTHRFEQCEMFLNSKMLNLLDSFPLLDLLRGEYFT